MIREPVTSSNVVSIGYDTVTKTLEVEFKGGIYVYDDVPPSVHGDLMLAESFGKFINTHIKDSYTFTKQ